MIFVLGAGLLAFVLVLLARRRHISGSWVDKTLIASWGITIAAEIIGTLAHVSGVLLSVPVFAIGVLVVVRSSWKLGDLSVVVLVAGMGLGLAYLIDAATDSDTGSYNDQGALWLTALGVVLGLIALASSFVRRRHRH
jgi:LPXTG-motif cell wall-anchored protein